MSSKNLFKISFDSQNFIFFVPNKFRYETIKNQSNKELDFRINLIEQCVVDPSLTKQDILNLPIGIVYEITHVIECMFKKC